MMHRMLQVTHIERLRGVVKPLLPERVGQENSVMQI